MEVGWGEWMLRFQSNFLNLSEVASSDISSIVKKHIVATGYGIGRFLTPKN